MSETLYRKYRPLTFSDVTDQNHVKVALLNQLRTNSVSHAYLFSGPRGVGKTTLARILAKAVNCQELKDGEPCNSCSACQMISDNVTMDVFEIDAASNTGVDHVRENIIDASRFRPTQLKKKVFIIDEVHGLSTAAFNALLKTLEEPPEHVLFIMATTELHKIPETVISRCQRFDFHRLRSEDIVERLKNIAKKEGYKVDDDVLHSLAKFSDGCLRDAESLFGQILAVTDDKQITLSQASLVLPLTHLKLIHSFLDALSRRSGEEALSIVSQLVEEGVRIRPFENELIETLREQMINQIKGSQVDFSFTANEAKKLLELIISHRDKFSNERIPELALELIVVNWCTLSDNEPRHNQKNDQEPPVTPQAPRTVQPTTKDLNQPTNNEPKPQVNKNVSTTLEQVKLKWSECLGLIKEQSGTLPVLLQDAGLLGLDGATIRLGVHMRFSADQLNESRNQKLMAKILQEIYKEPLFIKAEYLEAEADETVAGLLQTFGGKVMQN